MTEELKQIKYTAPAPVKKTRRSKKAQVAEKVGGADPLPALSTTRVVGGAKPVLKVSIPYTESAKTPSPIKHIAKQAASIVPTTVKVVSKPVIVKKAEVISPKVVVSQNKRKNMTLKRKFTNKRITIHVENSKKLKKLRDNAEKNVNNMSPCAILKSLKEKGLVRPNANPPDSLNRAMMLDIMMFPKPL